MPEIILLCLLLGAFAGLIAGLFGVGGGLVLVPFLVWLYEGIGFDKELIMIMAVATSLATIIVTSIASGFAHHRLGALHWQTVYRLAPGILAGAAMGSLIADSLPSGALRIVFAGFLIYVALRMGFRIQPESGHLAPKPVWLAGAGGVIGAVSAILGIGGGTLTVPFLVKCNYSMRHAVAISSACGLPIAVSGTVGYVILGWGNTGLPEWSLGYIYLPAFFGIIALSAPLAPVGAKLAHQLPAQRLKRCFAVLLLFMAVKMVW